MGGRAGDQVVAATAQLQDIGISGYVVTPDGTTILLKNNRDAPIRITDVKLAGKYCIPNPLSDLPTVLSIGQIKTIFCPNINESAVGIRYDHTVEIEWSYITSQATNVQFLERPLVGIVGASTAEPPISGYYLNISLIGSGSILVNDVTNILTEEIIFFEENSTVLLEAFPSEGWEFINWIGPVSDVISSNNTLIMNTNYVLIANFSYDPEYSFSCDSINEFGFYNGSGTVESPFGICNITMLQNMNNNLSAHYLLLQNIDASDTVNWNNGSGFEPIGNCGDDATCSSDKNYFSGSFNGSGYVISNLFVNRSSEGLGLFGSSTGIISQVGIINSEIHGGAYMGGIVGYLGGGSIFHTYFIGSVIGSHYIGGLVGWQNSGNIINSFKKGIISGSWLYTGGLVGYSQGGRIYDSFVSSNITGVHQTGGIAGHSHSSRLVRTYWDREVSNINNQCGLNPGGCNNLFGKTTSEMQQQATFVDWDFDTVWEIDEENSYPWLQNLPNPYN